MSEEQIGWTVEKCYRDEYNRDATYTVGCYLSKQKAEAVAKERNDSIVADLRKNEMRDFEKKVKEIGEHNALVDAGFRSGPHRSVTFTTKYPEGWVPGCYYDGYSVEPIEWDD